MRITNWLARWGAAFMLGLAMTGAVAGCGSSGTPDSTTQLLERNTDDLPTDLAATLARDDLAVQGAAFDGREIDEQTALDVFAGAYDPEVIGTPKAYAVEVSSSLETRLPSGTSAWMLHVPGVEQDITGPIAPDQKVSEEPEPMVLTTDMFVFIDAVSGRHLTTVYIGPEQN